MRTSRNCCKKKTIKSLIKMKFLSIIWMPWCLSEFLYWNPDPKPQDCNLNQTILNKSANDCIDIWINNITNGHPRCLGSHSTYNLLHKASPNWNINNTSSCTAISYSCNVGLSRMSPLHLLLLPYRWTFVPSVFYPSLRMKSKNSFFDKRLLWTWTEGGFFQIAICC